VLARAIARMGLGTTVDIHPANLLVPSSVRAVGTATSCSVAWTASKDETD
jgi:hypothetical protein